MKLEKPQESPKAENSEITSLIPGTYGGADGTRTRNFRDHHHTNPATCAGSFSQERAPRKPQEWSGGSKPGETYSEIKARLIALWRAGSGPLGAEISDRRRAQLCRDQYVPYMVRFWARVVEGDDGCWNWIGVRDCYGHGRAHFRNTVIRAHRFSWEKHNGPLPAYARVLHSCDNPACVNPDHLRAGAPAQVKQIGQFDKNTVSTAVILAALFLACTPDPAPEMHGNDPGAEFVVQPAVWSLANGEPCGVVVCVETDDGGLECD